MELLLARSGSAARRSALNLRPEEKLYTGLTALAVVAALGGIVRVDPAWLGTAAALALAVVAGNLPLLRWFARQRGVGFALAVIPLRLLYYVLSVVSAVAGGVKHLTGGRPAATAHAVSASRSAATNPGNP